MYHRPFHMVIEIDLQNCSVKQQDYISDLGTQYSLYTNPNSHHALIDISGVLEAKHLTIIEIFNTEFESNEYRILYQDTKNDFIQELYGNLESAFDLKFAVQVKEYIHYSKPISLNTPQNS